MSALDLIAAACLSPLLLVQAIALRKRALRLPEAAGARFGKTGSGPTLRLLIVGDSSAAGVGVAHQDMALTGQILQSLAPLFRVHWHLIAQTGATTPSTLATLGDCDLPQADNVLIVLGVNDVTRGRPLKAWLRSHLLLKAALRQQTGAKRIYIGQIPPLGEFPLLPQPLRWFLGRRAVRFDAALRQTITEDREAHYIPLPDMLDAADMAQDGFHPGPVIYAAWGQEVARRIISDGPSS